MPAREHVYLFVRQDLPIPQQIVQTNHATWRIASLYGNNDSPSIVLIGVPDRAALLEVSGICRDHAIPHHLWVEPDWDYGITAISTAAISGTKRQAFAGYELWKLEKCAISSFGRAAPSKGDGAGIEASMAHQV